ncbi:MAG: hypothetical protein IT355_14425 [Gemmatimonadaceae bacterium]|nr:hypothetical protein [Gemmatimonadaceae bacterium]
MSSLLNEAASLLTPEFVQGAAHAFGVPPDGMRKALAAALPTVLGTAADRSADAAFMREFLQSATHAANAGEASTAAAGLAESLANGGRSFLLELGHDTAVTLLGGSGDAIAGMVGRMADDGEAGAGIVDVTAGLALSLIGNRVRSEGLDAAALAGLLAAEKERLMRAVPGPIGGLLQISQFANRSPAAGRTPTPTPTRNPRLPAPVMPLSAAATVGSAMPFVAGIILGLAVLAWLYLKRPEPMSTATRASLAGVVPRP